MAKNDIPKIEWDDQNCTGFGGFRVVENLEHFVPPADWEVDPADPSHFLPTYKPCRYRRLTQGTKGGRPFVKIHCLLFEDVVDMATCRDCTDLQPPQETMSIDVSSIENAKSREDAKDEIKKIFDERRKEHAKEVQQAGDINIQQIMGATDIANPPDGDTVFSRDQPGSEYIRKGKEPRATKQSRTAWEPCVYRQEASSSDCGACTHFVCGCEECPLFNKQLTKRDCRECQHRKEN